MTSPYAVQSILQLDLEEGVTLKGLVSIPDSAKNVIILSQLSSDYLENDQVTDFLNRNNFATVNVDLLTRDEFEDFDNRYDVELLTSRLNKIIQWTKENYPEISDSIGLLGSGKAAAAALRVAAGLNENVKAIVCRSGRPDLVFDVIHLVEVPTLFVVGKLDPEVEEYNHQACRKMKTNVKFIPINGASHLLSEPGKLDEFTKEMVKWFEQELVNPKEARFVNN